MLPVLHPQRTVNGCKCKASWSPSSVQQLPGLLAALSSGAKPSDTAATATSTPAAYNYCANPDADPNGSWCEIEQDGYCSNLRNNYWDYCDPACSATNTGPA